MSKEKEPGSLDSLLEWMQQQNKSEGKIDKAFAQYDKVIEDEDGVMAKFYHTILDPAQKDLYQEFKKNMMKEFDNDVNKNVEGKHRESIYKAMVEALKKFFEKTNKGMLEPLDEKADLHDQYTYLAKAYDDAMHRPDGKGLSGIMDTLIDKSEKLTDLLKIMDATTSSYTGQYEHLLKGQAAQVFLGGFKQGQIATHVYGEIHSDDGPHKIENKMKWYSQGLNEILEARGGYKGQALPEGKELKDYHVTHVGKK